MSATRPIVLRPAPDPDVVSALSDVDPVAARVFAVRGVTEADELDYGLAHLAPVSQLDNVDSAVDLLLA